MGKFDQGNSKAAKLTNEEVWQIKERYAKGDCTQASLCREYKVSKETIGRIIRGETRQGVPDPKREPTPEELNAQAAAFYARLNKQAASLPVAAERKADRMLDQLSDRARAYGVKEDSE